MREATAARRKLAKREKAKRERMLLAQQTSDGLDPRMRAKLHAAALKMDEDPKHRRAVEAAVLRKRVSEARGVARVDVPIPAPERAIPAGVGERRLAAMPVAPEPATAKGKKKKT